MPHTQQAAMSPPEHPPQEPPSPDSTDSPEAQDATVVHLHRKRPTAPTPPTGDGGTFQGTPMPASTSPSPVPEEGSPEWRLAALAQALLAEQERSLTDPAVASGYDAGLTLALRIVDGARAAGGLPQSTYADLIGTLEAARRAAAVVNPDHGP